MTVALQKVDAAIVVFSLVLVTGEMTIAVTQSHG
jgi:hypothetical protein